MNNNKSGENYMEQSNNKFIESMKQLNKMVEPIREKSQQIQDFFKRMSEQVSNFANLFNSSKIYDSFLLPIKQLSLQLEEAKKDPDSIMNYLLYVDDLSKYFWAMPYDIDTATLKKIFENVNSEKEFDDYMKKYFDKRKLQNLFSDIKLKISKKHIIIFGQIEQGFYNKQYALINNAIISIIDDELAYYIFNKGETKRKDIFTPIIEEFNKKDIDECNFLDLFYLEMLNNNLNILFDNVDFSNIVINNNKDIRRHTTQHGKKYSNKKIVSIMLLNTLYNLLYIKDNLKEYKGSLKTKKEKNGSKKYTL